MWYGGRVTGGCRSRELWCMRTPNHKVSRTCTHANTTVGVYAHIETMVGVYVHTRVCIVVSRWYTRRVDIRLPGKGSSNSHDAMPVC